MTRCLCYSPQRPASYLLSPYQVLRRVGKVDYLVDMHDRRKRKRVLMLQKWHKPTVTATSYMAEEIPSDREETEVPVWKEDDGSDPKLMIGSQLTSDERKELEELLQRYASVLQNQPGWTTLVEHRICTGHANPIRLLPYRIPYARRGAVQKELREMLDCGIIERSRSEWAAPIVLVKRRGVCDCVWTTDG